jgi:uncharacterized protein (TIGR02453 family)
VSDSSCTKNANNPAMPTPNAMSTRRCNCFWVVSERSVGLSMQLFCHACNFSVVFGVQAGHTPVGLRLDCRVRRDTLSAMFNGFAPEALEFYEGLEADNSKVYWTDHKPTFDTHVKGAMAALLDTMPSLYQPFHVFRPNRDVRFAKDKSPYKTMHGASSETDGSSIYYTHLSAKGVFAAAGMYMLETDQVARLRAAIADNKTGPAVVKIIAALEKKGFQVGHGAQDPLKTTPKGYPADHPRIELLRWKGLITATDITDETVVQSPEVRDQILAFWKAAAPLLAWLDTNVGPTTISRER